MSEYFEIVVIDDHPTERALLGLVLAQAFPAAEIMQISKPIELVEYLHQGRCDVAVVERTVPWGEGPRLLNTIKQKFPQAVIIQTGREPLTRFGSGEIQLRLDAYLTKDAAGMVEMGPTIRALRRRRASWGGTARPGGAEPQAARADLRQAQSAVTGSGWGRGGPDEAAQAASQAQSPSASDTSPGSEELEQLAYAVSHDLQEPLQQMARGIERILENGGERLGDNVQAEIGRLERNVVRLQEMVDAVLAYSRIGTRFQTEERVDLNVVVQDALAGLQSTIAESGAQISVAALPEVTGDRRLLTQLMQNLVGNALKFRGARAPRVQIGVTDLDAFWQLDVTDNGIGIDPKFAERIFGMFVRLHAEQRFPGTGIGLTLCRRIARRHGGDIWVSSIPDVGSTFHVTLAKSTLAQQAPPETAQGAGRSAAAFAWSGG